MSIIGCADHSWPHAFGLIVHKYMSEPSASRFTLLQAESQNPALFDMGNKKDKDYIKDMSVGGCIFKRLYLTPSGHARLISSMKLMLSLST